VWIEDLAPNSIFANTVAVGWLERDHAYPVGVIAVEVFEKLAALLTDPWQPAVAGGGHGCDLCLYKPEAMGGSNVFVPGNGKVFVAPELILHYMNAHQYSPPDEFSRAVIACPPMRSPAYRKALLAAGGGVLLREPPAT
jgi:hypothetical protein